MKWIHGTVSFLRAVGSGPGHLLSALFWIRLERVLAHFSGKGMELLELDGSLDVFQPGLQCA